MMKSDTKFTIEHGLYGAVFFLAAAIRLINLAQLPLSDLESQIAYQAHQLAEGVNLVNLEAHPGYLSFTSLLFFLLGSDTFAARLLPALSGALLSLTPIGFRSLIGKKPAVILAFLFALDPGWLAISRQADGYSFAVSMLLFGLAAVLARKTAFAGILLGLALTGGPSFWQGVLILILTIGLYKFVFSLDTGEQGSIFTGFKVPLRPFLFWVVGTVLLFGSLFLAIPNNLNGITTSLWEYLRGWGQTTGVPVLHLLLALLVYQPLSLLFALGQAFHTARKNSEIDRFLIVWMLTALIVVLVYPSRQVVGLGWALLPMLTLAARSLVALFNFRIADRMVAIILALVVFVLLVFNWLNLLGTLHPIQGNLGQQLRWIGIGISLMLIIGAVFMVRWGWSGTISNLGALWGIMAALTLFTLSAAWRAGGLSHYPETQLWRTAPMIAEEDILLTSIGDIAEWNTGSRDGLDLVVVDLPKPSLQWVLRHYNHVEFVDLLPPQESPSMVLTSYLPSLELAATYRGQDFSWGVQPTWSLMVAEEWLRWSLVKSATLERDLILLWVREDKFPGWEPTQE